MKKKNDLPLIQKDLLTHFRANGTRTENKKLNTSNNKKLGIENIEAYYKSRVMEWLHKS